jgi:hypothetical protein
MAGHTATAGNTAKASDTATARYPVMAGPVPAIRSGISTTTDGRDRPGHDGGGRNSGGRDVTHFSCVASVISGPSDSEPSSL